MGSITHEALVRVSKEASELYLPSRVPVLNKLPSSFEFYQNYVAKNIPVVIKDGVKHWPALLKWTDDYLREKLGEKQISVALTPNGYADAPVGNRFVLPHEEKMTFPEFLALLQENRRGRGPVVYVQNQNSSFTEEFNVVVEDIDMNMSWANDVFGKQPDAVNFWMGGKQSVTSLHKDHYENIYTVIRGRKTFLLYPPTDICYLKIERLIPAKYVKTDDGFEIVDKCCTVCKTLDVDNEIQMENEGDLNGSKRCCRSSEIPWITTDPLKEVDPNSHQVEVQLEAGDLLYLPSLWFHHVRQTDSTIAVNFWYDMEYDIKYVYFKLLEELHEVHA